MAHLNDARDKVISAGLALVASEARPRVLLVDKHPVGKVEPPEVHAEDADRVGGTLPFGGPVVCEGGRLARWRLVGKMAVRKGRGGNRSAMPISFHQVSVTLSLSSTLKVGQYHPPHSKLPYIIRSI